LQVAVDAVGIHSKLSVFWADLLPYYHFSIKGGAIFELVTMYLEGEEGHPTLTKSKPIREKTVLKIGKYGQLITLLQNKINAFVDKIVETVDKLDSEQ
jgi:pyruvate/oxaloacetate carboxyltransferase